MNNPPYLALDIGDRYIGLAYSEAGILAKELETIDRKNLTDQAVFEKISQQIEKHDIQTLVIGLPISADGAENDRCARIRQFSQKLEKYLKTFYFLLSTFYFPEDFSSFDALDLLKQKTSKKEKFQPDHAISAKLILERFLEERPNQ